MADITKVLLASENFQENTFANLRQIWRNQEFTDVTLVSSDGFQLQAHKNVLCSSSSFFRRILIENQHPIVLLYMSGVSRKELELLLEFTYTGACQVEVADLKSFLKTGEELGYEGLLEAATGQEIPNYKNDLLEELDKEIRSPKESFGMGQLTKNLTLEEPPDSSEPHLVSTKVEKAADVENVDIDVQPHTGELVTVEESLHSSYLDRTLEETFVGNQAKDDKNQATDDEEGEQESESTSATELEDEHSEVKIEDKMTCESCGFTTLSSRHLTRHQIAMGHFSSRLRFKCKLCPFRANTTRRIYAHKEKHSEESFQCDQCPRKFKRRRDLAKHTETGHDTFKCKYCDYEAATEKNLKKHVITMQKYGEEAHTSKSSHIGTKDETGQNSSQLNFENANIDAQAHTGELVTVEEHAHSRSLDWTLEETFVGNQATDDKNQATDDEKVEQESESTSATELEDGHSEVKIENKLTCESCGFKTLSSGHLAKHQIAMGHFNSKLRFKCKLCPFRANTFRRIYDHNYRMHSEKSFQCDQCPRKYKRKSELTLHMKKGCGKYGHGKYSKYYDYEAPTETFVGNQAKDDKNQVADDEEGEQESESTSTTELEDGHGDVKMENKLTCESCGYTTLSSGSLTRHQTTMGHFSSRLRFKCKLCPFRANSKTRIYHHNKTRHEGLKFKCDQCDRSYNDKRNLVTHRTNVHDGFKCDYCGHQSRSEKRLMTHIRKMQKLNEEMHI